MSIEKTGRTVEEALAAALSELNLTEADVDVQVLQEAKTGSSASASATPASL